MILLNRHIQALIVKFLIALAVTGLLILFTGINLWGGFLIALTMTMVTYLVADLPFLMILGRNLTLALDAAVAVPVLWGMSWLYTGSYLSAAVLMVLALTVAAGEWVFHGYAYKNGVFGNTPKRSKNK